MNTSSDFSSVLNNTCFLIVAVVAIISSISPQAFSQSYQVEPNSSVIYPTPPTGALVSDGQFYGTPSGTTNGNPTAIYPGQMINGERVVAIKSAPSRQTITSANSSSNGSTVRVDKIPRTIFPTPNNLAAPASGESSNTETPSVPKSSADLTENNGPKVPQGDSLSPIDEELMAEIREIRAQLGGGIGKTLEGLDEMPPINGLGEIEIAPAPIGDTDSKSNSPEAMFEEQLRSVITDNSPLAPDATGIKNGSRADEQQQGQRVAKSLDPNYEKLSAEIEAVREQLGGGIAKSLEGLGEMPEIDGMEKTETLKDFAAELETLADRLEGIGIKDTGKQLRQHASDLRNQARQ